MPVISIEDTGPVRVIRLDRPSVRNALDLDMRRTLMRVLDEAGNDAAVRAVVLTGTGSAFCSGMDLDELRTLSERSSAEQRADSRAMADLFLGLAQLPKPVVAAVNGAAVAGGAGLVTACDVAVMSSSARIGYSEARIGFVAALVSVFLLRQVGEKHARDLLLSARLIDAQTALRIGLVNEVVEDALVLERAIERATAMARNAPGSLAMTKALLSSLPGMGIEDALRYAVELNALARSGDELKDGIRAFFEARGSSGRDTA